MYDHSERDSPLLEFVIQTLGMASGPTESFSMLHQLQSWELLIHLKRLEEYQTTSVMEHIHFYWSIIFMSRIIWCPSFCILHPTFSSAHFLFLSFFLNSSSISFVTFLFCHSTLRAHNSVLCSTLDLI